jgi:hypothetical protein
MISHGASPPPKYQGQGTWATDKQVLLWAVGWTEDCFLLRKLNLV